jgi:hypothetical protein
LSLILRKISSSLASSTRPLQLPPQAGHLPLCPSHGDVLNRHNCRCQSQHLLKAEQAVSSNGTSLRLTTVFVLSEGRAGFWALCRCWNFFQCSATSSGRTDS